MGDAQRKVASFHGYNGKFEGANKFCIKFQKIML
jgi:hypothetical protein